MIMNKAFESIKIYAEAFLKVLQLFYPEIPITFKIETKPNNLHLNINKKNYAWELINLDKIEHIDDRKIHVSTDTWNIDINFNRINKEVK